MIIFDGEYDFKKYSTIIVTSATFIIYTHTHSNQLFLYLLLDNSVITYCIANTITQLPLGMC
ncbi:MAG: hypothetical protein ACI8RD_009055 [Bacillariaceae sp.]|jgi:hypothetical protein